MSHVFISMTLSASPPPQNDVTHASGPVDASASVTRLLPHGTHTSIALAPLAFTAALQKPRGHARQLSAVDAADELASAYVPRGHGVQSVWPGTAAK